RQALKVREYVDVAGAPALFDQLLFHEKAGSEEAVYAILVSVQPLVEVGLCGEHKRAPPPPRVAALANRVPEPATAATFASVPVRDHVVAWAKQLEIVEMVKHRNALRLQFPENGWREVVIDVAHVRHIGTKLPNHPPQPFASLSRVDGMAGKPDLIQSSPRVLKVQMWDEV